MENPFKYSDDNKRYHTLYYHNKHTFGGRIFKAVLDGGFTCPNKDGACGFGGCSYCISGGSEFSGKGSVKEQFEKEKERIFKKWGKVGLIPYFQSGTSTYAPLEKLKALFEEAVSFEGAVGLSVATRADCLDKDKINYLKELSKRTHLTVELGLQTTFDKTAEIINRGHSFEDFLSTYSLLKEKGIRICVHIINGLPFETKEMMIENARVLGRLKPDGMKIHLLHIMQGSRIAEDFKKGVFSEMTFEDYIDVVCRQLELLPAETVIERITGDGSKDKLIAPLWSKNKIAVLGTIDKTLFERNTFQGKLFKE